MKDSLLLVKQIWQMSLQLSLGSEDSDGALSGRFYEEHLSES